MTSHILKYSFFVTVGLVPLLSACAGLPKPVQPDAPDHVIWSVDPTIKVRNLEADADYTLELERMIPGRKYPVLRSVMTYKTNARGHFDTGSGPADTPPALRPYLPFQNMVSLEGSSTLKPGYLGIRILDSENAVIVEKRVKYGPDARVMVEEPLGDGFPGAFILRSKDQSSPRPAIVILGGSEGGDRSARAQAPTFAAQGYTVLGLPYYSPGWGGEDARIPGLPTAFDELPVDYLEEAVAELRKRADVDAGSISLFGGSKGGEYVLLAGSLIDDQSPGGGFCSIVADVPSDVVWEGWGRGSSDERYSSFSWRGEGLPFVPYVDMGRALNRRQTGDAYTMTDAHENGRKAHPERAAAARIQTEMIDEPVLLIGGDKDTTWASGPMSRAIKMTRDEAGLVTELYVYPEGTHSVGGNPLTRTHEANLGPRVENYPAMMAFLKRHSTRKDCRD